MQYYRVDEERVKLAGPDRAAAEWILRNEGAIRWKNAEKPLKNYNFLPSTDFENYKIEDIDLTATSVIGLGFEHLGMLPIRIMNQRAVLFVFVFCYSYCSFDIYLSNHMFIYFLICSCLLENSFTKDMKLPFLNYFKSNLKTDLFIFNEPLIYNRKFNLFLICTDLL